MATSLSVLNLPHEAQERLERLYIKSVEAFAARVATDEGAEDIRVLLGISPTLMETLVKKSRSFAPVKPKD